jgi:hypothetical protein
MISRAARRRRRGPREGEVDGDDRCGGMAPLRKDRQALAKEDKQIGGAVEVDVDNGTNRFVRRGIKVLDEIDSVIEVAVRLAAHERALFVILLDIGSAVEVRVDRDVGELPLAIVGMPDIGPAVAVLILAADVTRG